MTIPTTAVTCRAYSQDGNPIHGATFAFRLNRLETYNGLVVPQLVTVTTDAGGVAVADLFPNALGVVGSQYIVRGRDAVGRRFLDSYATIPDADCELDDVLMLTAYGVTVADSALPATSAPLQSSGTAGTIGASTKYAREDHIHPLPPGASPSSTTPAVNGTASAGSEGSFARGDHVHPTDTSRAAQSALDSLSGTVSGKADQSALNALSDTVGTKAPTDSPALTGVPTAPTATGGTSTTQLATTAFVAAALAARTEIHQLAMSDLSTEITTGESKAYFRAPKACTLVGIKLSLLGASTSGPVTVDLLKNWSSVLTTKPTVLATQKTSVTSGVTPVFSSTAVAADDELSLSITGAGTGAKGLIAAIEVAL